MFGPLDDSDNTDDEESDETESSDSNNDLLLDQSTLTTTTSYTTVLANEEQKDDDIVSETKSVSDATAILNNSFSDQQSDNRPHPNGNCESDEPPISHMLSDALEEIERAEISGDEEIQEHVKEITEQMNDDTLKLVDENNKPEMISLMLTTDTREDKDVVDINSIGVPAPDTPTPLETDDTTQTFDCDISNSDDQSVNKTGIERSQWLQRPAVVIITETSDRRSSPSNSSKSDVAGNNDYNESETNQMTPDLVSSSSGELLLSYSKEDMLASSDIMLDMPCSTDDLLGESELSECLSSVPEITATDKWELPVGGTVDEKMAFLMNKVNATLTCNA